jgi:lysophospholipase L1-like esterase
MAQVSTYPTRDLAQVLGVDTSGNVGLASPSYSTGVIFAQEGDSRTADGGANPGTWTRKSNRMVSYWIEALTRGAVQFPSTLNTAVGGSTSTAILARMPASIAAAKAAGASGFLLLGCATNDPGASITLATSLANLTAIEGLVKGAGMVCVWIGELPRGDTSFTGAGLSTTAQREHLAQVARWQQGRNIYKNVVTVSPWGDLADVATAANDALGYARVGLMYDGLHPSPAGAYRIALRALPAFQALFGPAAGRWNNAPLTGADLYSATNLFGLVTLNPNMGGTAGSLTTGVTGSAPDSWAVSNNCNGTFAVVSSLVTDTDGTRWWRHVCSGTTGTGNQYYRIRQDVNAGTRGVAIGTKYSAAAAWRTQAAHTGLLAVDVSCWGGASNGVEFSSAGVAGLATEAGFTTDALDCAISSSPFALPASSTALRTAIVLTFAPSTAISLTFDVTAAGARPSS